MVASIAPNATHEQSTSCPTTTWFSPIYVAICSAAQFIYPESIFRHDNPAATSIFIKLQEFFRRAGNLVHAIFQKEKH